MILPKRKGLNDVALYDSTGNATKGNQTGNEDRAVLDRGPPQQ